MAIIAGGSSRGVGKTALERISPEMKAWLRERLSFPS
jgi:hypothetical protein